jgi:hypothetical protein
MFAYVYVVRSPDLSTTKIGYSSNFKSRLAGLASSSSAPFQWQPWKVYQLENAVDARRLEGLVRSDKSLSEYLVPGKREFFQCRPTIVTAVLETLALIHEIGILKNFPYCGEAVDCIAKLYPSMPSEVLASFSDREAAAYWIGAQDVLRVLSYLEGLEIDAEDFKALAKSLNINRNHSGIEAWQSIVGHFGNCSVPRSRQIAESAVHVIAQRMADARDEWQSDD